MRLTQEQADEILSVHNSLWNALYDYDSSYHCLTWKGSTYDIYIPEHRGYSLVVLPNTQSTEFVWVTQDLNQSSYGTLAILESRQKDIDHRITWVTQKTLNKIQYRANIRSTTNSSGKLVDCTIQRYDDIGAETVWSLNPLFISKEAEF